MRIERPAESGRPRRDGRRRRGATLVEVLVAVLILAILALAGGAVVQIGQADTIRQKYKRAAIEAANARMETVTRGWVYDDVAALVGNPTGTSLTLNGVAGFAMTTTVVNAGGSADNCLKVRVTVVFEKKSGESVALETYRSR